MKYMYKLYLLCCITMIQFGCSKQQTPQNDLLTSEWQFRKAGDSIWLPSTVPGTVHTDLMENKLIPDPFFRFNEHEVKWVEDADWEYHTAFQISHELASYTHIDLEFGGLDTYADVYLNDSLILVADNMFVGWSVPVKNHIRIGENTLRIYFHSAVKMGMEKLKRVPYTLMAANEIAPEDERTNVFTRKAPFHYGWDWGPRLVTCGIWKPIKINAWNSIKMEDLYVKPIDITEIKAIYNAIVEVVSDEDSEKNFEVWVDDKTITTLADVAIRKGKNIVEVNFTIDKPEFWWTSGLGGQKIYHVEVRMMDRNKPLQKLNTRIGVRTLELVQEKDSIGTSFFFKLNGVPVFMKGANYIPSDIFTTRNTIENYKRVVNDAIKANMNMIRIWGGAIYENNEFYDLLDENGILAWNDFMFACNVQPDDSLHLENIKKEAEYNVKRLRNHPSIALWCGNNENLVAWHEWGWKDRVTKEQSAALWSVYEKIFYNILPDVVERFHPEISYWPSSPQSAENQLPDRVSGDVHDWSVWFGDAPFSAYAENVPRFVSEYGVQSFPEMKTIKSFANEDDMAYRSPVMEHRQRSLMPWIEENYNGNEMIKRYIGRYYKVPEKFESFVYLSQLMQAEAVKYAVEAHRRNMPQCMGSLYWQINDCWPTMSWSSVDYFGRWKALHYSLKNAFQPVYPIISRNNNDIQIKIANDRLKSEKATIIAVLYDFNGNKIWENQKEIELLANSSPTYFSIAEKELLKGADPGKCVLAVEVNIENQVVADNLFYFKDFKELKLEKPTLKTEIERISDEEFEITVTSEKLAKNVAFYTATSEGFFSNNYFDVIPGRKYKIKYNGHSKSFNQELIIMSLNDQRGS